MRRELCRLDLLWLLLDMAEHKEKGSSALIENMQADSKEDSAHSEENARRRRPNVRLNPEEVRHEQMLKLKQARGGALAAVTAKRREIDELMQNPANVELARSKFEHVQDLFERFARVHFDMQDLLKDDKV